MTRLFADFAYGDGPVATCFWSETSHLAPFAPLKGDTRADVVVVGAGYTGLNAALRLAQSGADVVLLDAHQPGWGASGRNGGFCCLGGTYASDATLDRRFGRDARLAQRRVERDAVDHVRTLLATHDIDAEIHSDGETELAHSPKAWAAMQEDTGSWEENYGVTPRLHAPQDLVAEGLGGRFFGARTVSCGFALSPRKYAHGLAHAVKRAGARIHGDTLVAGIERRGAKYRVAVAQGAVIADQVVIATNGYSSECVPEWMAGRYLPVQSNILVTRVLTKKELAAQGWSSDQMCYDSLRLLHYFRLMPDGRFLFGRRGGLRSNPRSEAVMRRQARVDFERLFPAWAHVETPWFWSGMVCFSRGLVPFVGAVPGQPGMFAAFAYHGNGVALGSYAGAALADQMLGRQDGLPLPDPMRAPARRFPLGRARRVLMWPAYLGYALRDRFG